MESTVGLGSPGFSVALHADFVAYAQNQLQPRNRFEQIGGRETQARAAVLQDEFGFAWMRLGVDRRRAQAGVPAAEQQLDALRLTHTPASPTSRLSTFPGALGWFPAADIVRAF